MFMRPRDELLATLERMGERCCLYTWGGGKWLEVRCDCKYGAAKFGDHKMLGEETGCPELRMLHAIIEAMSDEQYMEWVDKAGGVVFALKPGEELVEVKSRPPQQRGRARRS